VPNECVGLIIGKGGETIRQLQQESKAKIQVAKKEIESSGVRNVFVDGPPERYEHAKNLIQAIVDEYQKAHAPPPGFTSIDYQIPNMITGLLIGKGGETLKRLMAKTKAQIIVPKVLDYTSPDRIIHIKGTDEQIDMVKKEIDSLARSCTRGGKLPFAPKEFVPPPFPYGLPPNCILSCQ